MNSERKREKQATGVVQPEGTSLGREVAQALRVQMLRQWAKAPVEVEGQKRAEQVVALRQAQALAQSGVSLLSTLRRVWHVSGRTGERTLHTLVAEWPQDEERWHPERLGWYKRPTLGDVLTGEVRL